MGQRGVKPRPHAEPVAREEELPGALVPDREGPLAVEAMDALLLFVFEQMQNYFGIGVGGEPVAPFEQDLAQLNVIEDLPIECDPEGTVFIGHGLGASLQVDYAEAGMPERGALVAIDGARIGSAMVERRNHSSDHFPARYFSGFAG